MSGVGLSIAEESKIDSEVDEAMDRIRDSVLLTDSVGRTVSIEFLDALSKRIDDLQGELMLERRRFGEGKIRKGKAAKG